MLFCRRSEVTRGGRGSFGARRNGPGEVPCRSAAQLAYSLLNLGWNCWALGVSPPFGRNVSCPCHVIRQAWRAVGGGLPLASCDGAGAGAMALLYDLILSVRVVMWRATHHARSPRCRIDARPGAGGSCGSAGIGDGRLPIVALGLYPAVY